MTEVGVLTALETKLALEDVVHHLIILTGISIVNEV
jgi:hypothetical protein